MAGHPAARDFDGWVAQLARPSRYATAKRHLLEAGDEARPAVRRGLGHRDRRVRLGCVRLLDHLADPEALVDLASALDDPEPEVVRHALHALACERCKDDACPLDDSLYVPRALAYTRDPNPDLRVAAVEALALVGRRRADVAEAIRLVADDDRHPAVRNAARGALRSVERARAAAT